MPVLRETRPTPVSRSSGFGLSASRASWPLVMVRSSSSPAEGELLAFDGGGGAAEAGRPEAEGAAGEEGRPALPLVQVDASSVPDEVRYVCGVEVSVPLLRVSLGGGGAVALVHRRGIRAALLGKGQTNHRGTRQLEPEVQRVRRDPKGQRSWARRPAGTRGIDCLGPVDGTLSMGPYSYAFTVLYITFADPGPPKGDQDGKRVKHTLPSRRHP